MPRKPPAASIDEYIAEFPPETQEVLERVRAIVKETVPEATETIAYDIPAFGLDGRRLVYFAGWKSHVSLYPVPDGDEAFKSAIAPYQSGKGTLRFDLGKPLPEEVIQRVVEAWTARIRSSK